MRENYDENLLEPTLLDDKRDEDQSEYEQNDELHYSIPTENRFNALLKKMDDRPISHHCLDEEQLHGNPVAHEVPLLHWMCLFGMFQLFLK